MNREEGAYMDMLIKEKSRLRKTVRKFKERELLIKKFIDDLYWEYDRMSSSGTETLDRLAKVCNVPTNAQYDIEKDEDMKTFQKRMGENK